MPYPIVEIEGIGNSYAEKLKGVGIHTTESLLKAASTPKGRRTLAAKSEIAEPLILKWTNCADLMRIKGIAKQYSELLEADNLAQAMKAINEEKHLCKVSPSVAVVRKWIDSAKALPARMSY